VSTRPNRQNRSTCSPMSVPIALMPFPPYEVPALRFVDLVQIQILGPVNHFARLDRLNRSDLRIRRGHWHCELRADSMTRLILASLVLAISILPLYAQSSSLHTDRSGYTTGTDGNRTVNTYSDRYGNTTGWVGGKYMSTYSDGYGGTTGTIGNKRITTYEDGYGNTTGTIGRDRINLYTGPSGTTTGTIGRRRLNCYTDRFRTTTCN
jgi:hypothetical protein